MHSRANDASKTKYERHTNGTATVNGAALSTRIHFTLPTHVMPDDRRPPSSVHRRLATTARHHLPTHNSHRHTSMHHTRANDAHTASYSVRRHSRPLRHLQPTRAHRPTSANIRNITASNGHHFRSLPAPANAS